MMNGGVSMIMQLVMQAVYRARVRVRVRVRVEIRADELESEVSERWGVHQRLGHDFPKGRSEPGSESKRQQPCRRTSSGSRDKELVRPWGPGGQIGSVNYLWVGVAMSCQGDQQGGSASVWVVRVLAGGASAGAAGWGRGLMLDG
jgi:hypothetical protein